MAVLAECPGCRKRQSLRNKECSCGTNLDKAKGSRRVVYWIGYRVFDPHRGKIIQRREKVGTSIKEAVDANGKRRSQKRENRIFDMLPESRDQTRDIVAWYQDLPRVKKLASYRRVKDILSHLNASLGGQRVGSVSYEDLSQYQEDRLEAGAAPRTVDYEVSVIKTMFKRAFYADKVDGSILKHLGRLDRKLRPGSNIRKQMFTVEQMVALREKSARHLRPMITMAFSTAMRQGEIFKLRWLWVDLKGGFIRLPANACKEKKPKSIPLSSSVIDELRSTPPHINHDQVFTYDGRPLAEEGAIKKSFRTACKDAGILYGRNTPGGLTFHDIRTTVKTWMLKAGIAKVVTASE